MSQTVLSVPSFCYINNPTNTHQKFMNAYFKWIVILNSNRLPKNKNDVIEQGNNYGRMF